MLLKELIVDLNFFKGKLVFSSFLRVVLVVLISGRICEKDIDFVWNVLERLDRIGRIFFKMNSILRNFFFFNFLNRLWVVV